MARDHRTLGAVLIFLLTIVLFPVDVRSEDAPSLDGRGYAGMGSAVWADATFKNGVDFARKGRFSEAADEFRLLGGFLTDVPIAEAIDTVDAAEGGMVDREAAAHLFGGIYACAIGDFLSAMDELAKATELDPSIALVYYYRASIYIAAGEDANAVSELDMAIELDPGFALAYSTRGAALYNEMEYLKALADFNTAVELDPMLASAYFGRGSVYSRARRFSQAISDFTRAIELRPDFTEAYNNRGILHMKVTKDINKGCADFKLLCELGSCEQYERLVGDGHCSGVGDRMVGGRSMR